MYAIRPPTAFLISRGAVPREIQTHYVVPTAPLGLIVLSYSVHELSIHKSKGDMHLCIAYCGISGMPQLYFIHYREKSF